MISFITKIERVNAFNPRQTFCDEPRRMRSEAEKAAIDKALQSYWGGRMNSRVAAWPDGYAAMVPVWDAVYVNNGVVPDIFGITLNPVETVRKPESTRAAFEAARLRGDIVVNPLFKSRYTASEQPVLRPKPGVTPTVQRHTVDLANQVGEMLCNRAMGDSARLYSVPFWELPLEEGSLYWQIHRMQMEEDDVEKVVYFKDEVAFQKEMQRVHSQIENSLEINSALVTSVRAEANSGVYDLLTELGELKETIGWAFGLLVDLATLYRKTRKEIQSAMKSGKTKGELATFAASKWMEYRYAISPLIYSLNDIMDYLETESPQYQTYRKGRTDKVAFSLFGKIHEVSVTERCFLKRRYGLDGMSNASKLKMSVASTAWELLPLSFIVDWFVQIGDFLSSIGIPADVSQEAAQYSWKINETVTLDTPLDTKIRFQLEMYKAQPINPASHIGINSDVFMNWKRWLDSASLGWLLARGLMKK